MNTCIRIVAAAGLASALLVTSVHAAESGFYLGGAVGQAQITDNPPQTGGQEVSETFTPYRAFAGYRIGVVPILDFAGEIGYSNLGTASGSTGGVATQYKAQGTDASVLVILPILLFDFYGRVGVMRYDLDKTFNGVTTNSSGSAGYYGAGVGVRVGPIGVRLEYDRVDNPDVNTFDVGMISIYWQF